MNLCSWERPVAASRRVHVADLHTVPSTTAWVTTPESLRGHRPLRLSPGSIRLWFCTPGAQPCPASLACPASQLRW